MQTAFVADKKLGLKLIHSFMHWHKQSLPHPFLFNNQPDALIIQIYSVIKLHMFRASSILTLFGSGHQTCMKHTCAEYTVENS